MPLTTRAELIEDGIENETATNAGGTATFPRGFKEVFNQFPLFVVEVRRIFFAIIFFVSVQDATC
jgi:hypothetical protein